MFTSIAVIASIFLGYKIVSGASTAVGVTKFQPEFEKVESLKFSVSSITGVAVIRVRNISTTALEVTQIYLDILAGGKKLADITANASVFGIIKIDPNGVTSVKVPFTASNKDLLVTLKNSFGANYPKSIEFEGNIEANGFKLPIKYSQAFDFSVVKETVNQVVNTITSFISEGVDLRIADLKQLGFKAPFRVYEEKTLLKSMYISGIKEIPMPGGLTPRLLETGFEYNRLTRSISKTAYPNFDMIKTTLTLVKQII